ncbi:MAG: thiamine-monophosphate kinase [Hyphomicrobiaceae bacterium]|jgi:thiamine-monophosphate kinase
MAKASFDQLGEFELIDAIRRLAVTRVRGSQSLKVGIGDDAAVFNPKGPVAQTTDTFVEGVHFKRSWLSAGALGRRAFRAAVSDLSAMGATPRWVLLSLSLPPDWFGPHAVALARGLVRDAATVGATLAGGNITAGRDLTITVTVSGVVSTAAVTRDRARAGDSVFVTGAPGLARAGLQALLEGRRRGRAVEAWRTPPLRTHLGKRLAAFAGLGAMIDVSDGLVQDLGHMARSSKVGVIVERDSLPLPASILRQAGSHRRAIEIVLAGGEDYELVFTTRPGREVAVQRLCLRLGVPVNRIGRVVAGSPAIVSEDGSDLGVAIRGHDHARTRRSK